jgi:hypothetical protein
VLTSYQERRHEEISKLSLRYLLNVSDQGGFKLDVSHSIFLVRRWNVDDLQRTFVEPISPSVRELLRMKLLKEEWKDQIIAYGQMEMNARMRQMAGLVFESMGQLQLQKEIALRLAPVTRQLGTGNPKWTMTQLNDNDRAGSSSTALNVENTSTVTSIN